MLMVAACVASLYYCMLTCDEMIVSAAEERGLIHADNAGCRIQDDDDTQVLSTRVVLDARLDLMMFKSSDSEGAEAHR
jgi:hypothetical protein